MERPLRTAETELFDECFITGTGSEILPVIQIDDHQVANGRPGPLTRRLQNAFFRITYGELAGEDVTMKNE
jgi:branched-subunit amino acid aminotransferase/4-amino-4-deoxychorismate lyase